MSLGSPLIRYWYNPSSDMVGDTVEAFLQEMAGPTLIHIPGRDRNRKRAICTLLHGNEPSGTRGVFRFLKEGIEPAVDLLCFIGCQSSVYQPGQQFGDFRFLAFHQVSHHTTIMFS